MSAIVPVGQVSAVAAVAARPSVDRQDQQTPQATPPAAPTPAPVVQAQPIIYYGGIDGMNATNLIVALQANGHVSGGYSARATEQGITPPPAILDRGA